MTLHPEIITWSKTRPSWQQDALRRLVDQASTTTDDIKELAEMCMAEHGIQVDNKVQPIPLTDIAHHDDDAQVDAVVLLSVSEMTNVNALQADQVLNVAPVGLTVVYGDNGVGKSGYVRVIKQLCRARGAADVVYPNVYAESNDAAYAKLHYSVGAKADEVTWTPTGARPPELRQISIFDSKSAAVYVTSENDVAYLPNGMDLFPRLVMLTDAVRIYLEAEIAGLEGQKDQWPDFEPTTAVYRQLIRLDAVNAKVAIDSLATISDSEKDRLASLRIQDKKYRSDDPAGQAIAQRQCAARLKAALARLEIIEAALSSSNLASVREAQEGLVAARAAAGFAVTGAFADAPLKGVGSATWNALWSAARRFAGGDAKPAQAFPPISGQLCVLCQEPITGESEARMQGFELFVRGETQKLVTETTDRLDVARAALTFLRPESIADTALIAEIKTLDTELERLLQECVTGYTLRRANAVAASSPDEWKAVAPLPSSPKAGFDKVIASVESDAAGFETATNPSEQRAVADALQELEAREKLASVLPRVDAQIEREARKAALKLGAATTNTTAITRRNTELLAAAVTQPLADGFSRQLLALNLTHIPITLASNRGEKARALHTLNLARKNTMRVDTDKVLSEGEHRCIALAAFFAEVSLQDSQSTLVFDDPVSSLDQSRREYVAKRIAAIAKTRPVLVLTHDLVFVWMLQKAAECADVELAPRLIRRTPDRAGLIEEDWPWDGLKVRKRIGAMRVMLVDLAKSAANDRQAYEKDIRIFYGKLRDTWERAVEEILFNGAIRRFGTEVKTQSLDQLHNVKETHLKTLETGMSKSSQWVQGHDHPPALGSAVPEPTEASADLEQLDKWIKEVKAIHED